MKNVSPSTESMNLRMLFSLWPEGKYKLDIGISVEYRIKFEYFAHIFENNKDVGIVGIEDD